MSFSRLKDVRPSFVRLALKHPGSGEDIGVTLHIVGKDSKQFQDLMVVFAKERAEAEAAGKPLDALEFGKRIVCAAVIGADGDEPFSPEELRAMLDSGEYNWVVEQVNEVLQDRASFFKGSLTNSVSA